MGCRFRQQRVVPTPITLYQNPAMPSTIFNHRFKYTLLSCGILGHLASKLRTKSCNGVTGCRSLVDVVAVAMRFHFVYMWYVKAV
jgi:hypothetical protein